MKKPCFNAQDLIQSLSELLLWTDVLKVLDTSQMNERRQLWDICFFPFNRQCQGIPDNIDHGSDNKAFPCVGSIAQCSPVLWRDNEWDTAKVDDECDGGVADDLFYRSMITSLFVPFCPFFNLSRSLFIKHIERYIHKHVPCSPATCTNKVTVHIIFPTQAHSSGWKPYSGGGGRKRWERDDKWVNNLTIYELCPVEYVK